MRQGARAMEQIKNRCLYTCDSIFKSFVEPELRVLVEPNDFTFYFHFTYSICV